MKRVYLITYDFKGSSEKYSHLFDEIKKFSGWWHYIANSWLIITEDSAKEIFGKLKPHVDNDINLLVIEVGKDRQGWLPEKAWEWLKKHLPREGGRRPE
ncbi:hypothetical protein ACRS2S_30425 [Achromobacter xylosoxidans]|uniref:hypothetical protein n=1 Tax=Alcaligenes xylosoxydans xylosoxydans TaxID=85698 RepID=UPI003EE27927